MNDREHAEEILQTARRDLRALRAMHDVESFPDEIFGFHAQQSVEKALIDLNTFAVQYRHESLYADDEEALDRSELADRIASLIDQVAAALHG